MGVEGGVDVWCGGRLGVGAAFVAVADGMGAGVWLVVGTGVWLGMGVVVPPGVGV